VSHPRPVCLRLDDDLVRADRATLVAAVVDRVRATSACLVMADVAALTADTATLDALARLQLEVRRAGAVLVLQHPSGRLRALLDLTGLAEALPVDDAPVPVPGSPVRALPGSVQVVGQAELREELGAHEVGDAGDAAVAHLEHVDRPRIVPPGDRAGLVLREGR
jgi:ABC-type transporter Mla MlaB component